MTNSIDVNLIAKVNEGHNHRVENAPSKTETNDLLCMDEI